MSKHTETVWILWSQSSLQGQDISNNEAQWAEVKRLSPPQLSLTAKWLQRGWSSSLSGSLWLLSATGSSPSHSNWWRPLWGGHCGCWKWGWPWLALCSSWGITAWAQKQWPSDWPSWCASASCWALGVGGAPTQLIKWLVWRSRWRSCSSSWERLKEEEDGGVKLTDYFITHGNIQ